MNGKLKSCPFCGGEADIIIERDFGVTVWCTKCECSLRPFGPADMEYSMPLEKHRITLVDMEALIYEASLIWNTRAYEQKEGD